MKAHSGIHTCCLDDIMCSNMCINVDMIKEITMMFECMYLAIVSKFQRLLAKSAENMLLAINKHT